MSVAFRLGLGFHALNNEGADGSNLMQPRRIDVGDLTYDGISGEIVRRHILENFVGLCRDNDPRIKLLPLSEGLHPDRGPIGIRAAARLIDGGAPLTSSNLYPAVRRAIEECAVLDVGGFLAAFGQDAAKDSDYLAEGAYLENFCAKLGSANPVKRETCFDVGWLISEDPQDLTVTQHSAYRNTSSLNSRFAQTMRSNTYGGVIRVDLHRIGTDDNWYLQTDDEHGLVARMAVDETEQRRRQVALVNAIVNYIASPTGARTAAWAPHVFLTEGAILLTSARTAPFISPINVDLSNASDSNPVSRNSNYRAATQALRNKADTWVWEFDDINGLLAASKQAINTLGENGGQETSNR